jgi:dTDP-4-dehydrorhamnose 3,5-epimerase
LSNIKGILKIQKKIISDERGSIRHMLKATDPEFDKFGEVYFSTAYLNVIKGWHLHTKQTQNYLVLSGKIKLVLFDCREDSETFKYVEEHYLSIANNYLIKIPPGVANGYKVVGNNEAIICNCSDLPHEPNEMLRYSPFDTDFCQYNWDLVHK